MPYALKAWNLLSVQDHPLCKKGSNHHANLPLEMYSFTL